MPHDTCNNVSYVGNTVSDNYASGTGIIIRHSVRYIQTSTLQGFWFLNFSKFPYKEMDILIH